MVNRHYETPIANIPIGHPHAESLLAHYLFNGRALSVIDLTQNQNDLSVVGATYVPAGLKFSANNQYAVLDNTKQVVNSEAGTVIIGFKSLSAFADASRVLFGSYGNASGEGDFVIITSGLLYFLFRDSVAEHWVRLPGPPTWETGVQIAILWDRNKAIWNGDNIVININGVHSTPQGSSLETSWNSFDVNSTLYVGNDAGDTSKECNGVFEYVSIHSKALREDLLKNIYENPYALSRKVRQI